MELARPGGRQDEARAIPGPVLVGVATAFGPTGSVSVSAIVPLIGGDQSCVTSSRDDLIVERNGCWVR